MLLPTVAVTEHTFEALVNPILGDYLGEGAFTVAYTHRADPSKVVKLSKKFPGCDPGAELYLRGCLTMFRTNPYAMRVYDARRLIIRGTQHAFTLAITERLDPLDDCAFEAQCLRDTINLGLCTEDAAAADLSNGLRYLMAVEFTRLTKYKDRPGFDLHMGNFMSRKGLPVLTDPFVF